METSVLFNDSVRRLRIVLPHRFGRAGMGAVRRYNARPHHEAARIKKIMSKLYLLHHVREVDDDSDDVKLIGIYSSEQKALEALELVKAQPGFRDFPDGFEISEAELDHTEWSEGFLTL
jgi:hypothetical protein